MGKFKVGDIVRVATREKMVEIHESGGCTSLLHYEYFTDVPYGEKRVVESVLDFAYTLETNGYTYYYHEDVLETV